MSRFSFETHRRNSLAWALVVILGLAVLTACAPAPPEKAVEVPAASLTAEPAAKEEATTSMTTGNGKTMTLTLKTLPDSRGYQYCELLIQYGDTGSDIYSTSPIAPCSLDWWDNLDLDAVAQELGADSAVKNGPQWWSMDEVGVMASEPVQIAGVEMNFGAHLPAGTVGMPHYQVFHPAKYQDLTWKKGQPTYQLVDPDGYVYVVQGYKVEKERLTTLGDEMKGLPEGWKYRVVSPDNDLVMNLTPAEPIPSVQDEFDSIYIRIPE